jgi:hypothetical protein
MHVVVRIAVVALFVIFVGVTGTHAYTIDFEDLPDSTVVTDQYQAFGVRFTGATVITAGVNLPEYEFPPHSGTNVIFDDGSPITVRFSEPVRDFAAHFTYVAPLTLTFYDLSDSVIGVVFSAFSSNSLLTGEPGSCPNELLSFAWNNGITRVVITGADTGSSFVLDDLTITAVPEPPSLFLLSAAVLGVVTLLRLTKRRLSPAEF